MSTTSKAAIQKATAVLLKKMMTAKNDYEQFLVIQEMRGLIQKEIGEWVAQLSVMMDNLEQTENEVLVAMRFSINDLLDFDAKLFDYQAPIFENAKAVLAAQIRGYKVLPTVSPIVLKKFSLPKLLKRFMSIQLNKA